eukprot:scaffold215878_cov19-Tisochrysis_lutea.AAC.1
MRRSAGRSRRRRKVRRGGWRDRGWACCGQGCVWLGRARRARWSRRRRVGRARGCRDECRVWSGTWRRGRPPAESVPRRAAPESVADITPLKVLRGS